MRDKPAVKFALYSALTIFEFAMWWLIAYLFLPPIVSGSLGLAFGALFALSLSVVLARAHRRYNFQSSSISEMGRDQRVGIVVDPARARGPAWLHNDLAGEQDK